MQYHKKNYMEMNIGESTKRVIGLDLIRSCAIFFVIAGHFFSLNTEFRTNVFEGVSMFIQGAFSMLFASGVPLFIMLTGYLNCNKTVSRQYYKGGIKALYHTCSSQL